jgi:hypothetical protein
MCLNPFVCILILEVDAEKKGTAGEGNGVRKFANNVVKLDT